MSRVLVTGASAGIGAAIARDLAGRGHDVFGTSRDPRRLSGVPGVRPIALDLADPRSVDAAVDRVLDAAGGLDVLINNAGSGAFGALEHFTDEELAHELRVLVLGPLGLVRRALPAMRAQGRGLVVNVTSLAADFPMPFMAPYSAGKAALKSFTQALALELCATPIRVVDLAPGDIETGFHDAMRRRDEGRTAGYEPNLRRAYRHIEANFRGAPPPELVARAVRRIVDSERGGYARVAVGELFQARMAPLLARLLPLRVIQFGIRHYYGLKTGDR